MSGLTWLNDLMLWLGKWFPRFILVKAGYSAVRFGRSGRSVELQPGLYCYWPIVTEVTTVSTWRRTTEIASQLHGREIVSMVIAYEVVSPRVMLLHFDDVFSQLDDRTQAHLGRAYHADKSNADISAAVLDGLRQEFVLHGVQIHSVDVVQRGWVLPLKNLNDWAQHSKADL